ncbi:MAG: hypothetical protein U0836_24030 [Pirellulales bacterium]
MTNENKAYIKIASGTFASDEDLEALRNHVREFWAERGHGVVVTVDCPERSADSTAASSCERLDPPEYWSEFVSNPLPPPHPSQTRAK